MLRRARGKSDVKMCVDGGGHSDVKNGHHDGDVGRLNKMLKVGSKFRC